MVAYGRVQALASLGLVAGEMAHEIANLLTGIRGCLHGLADGELPEARRPTDSDAARDGLARMDDIVRAMLDWARPRPPCLTLVDLDTLVESTLRLAGPVLRLEGARVTNSVPQSSPQVRGDRSQLMQVVLNLVTNAAHAVSPDGCVTLEMQTDGAHVVIRIHDDGHGIPPEHMERVHEPSFTTKARGTGLGLPVARDIVQAHGGDLTLSSRAGRGTTATVRLPRA